MNGRGSIIFQSTMIESWAMHIWYAKDEPVYQVGTALKRMLASSSMLVLNDLLIILIQIVGMISH